MRSKQEWEELADDLELLLRGELESESLREKYWNRPLSPVTESIMANVEHFLSDGDVRLKDPRYKQMQETEMEKLIVLLRAGGPRRRDSEDSLSW